ncbi:hypothetical protein CQA15_29250, partial [Klebsiella pneumoniae]|uniref:hypothetical protein n=1 Tax=Klebsiella pneumoniae TaxID=573 RepID=UPI000BCA5E69
MKVEVPAMRPPPYEVAEDVHLIAPNGFVSEGKFQSIITNKVVQVGPETRIVDATFMKVEVPAMRPPPYEVAEDVHLIAPNG